MYNITEAIIKDKKYCWSSYTMTFVMWCIMYVLNSQVYSVPRFKLNLKIVHFCYFQNTFPFVSMSRQTDDIGKKRPKKFVEQDRPIVTYWRLLLDVYTEIVTCWSLSYDLCTQVVSCWRLWIDIYVLKYVVTYWRLSFDVYTEVVTCWSLSHDIWTEAVTCWSLSCNVCTQVVTY